MTSALLSQLDHDLRSCGLRRLGHFSLRPDDGFSTARTLVLIGPDEPAFWPIFTDSAEFNDGASDPMDRWSTRTLTALATTHNATAVFPFGPQPYHPFYTWALRSGHFWASPIGFLVHAEAGLFASFRGALALPITIPDVQTTRPCDTCSDQPCKTACPVDAFANGYDAATCRAHLHTVQGADCMSKGCRARRACPIGQSRRNPAQSEFHMKAFR